MHCLATSLGAGVIILTWLQLGEISSDMRNTTLNKTYTEITFSSVGDYFPIVLLTLSAVWKIKYSKIHENR